MALYPLHLSIQDHASEGAEEGECISCCIMWHASRSVLDAASTCVLLQLQFEPEREKEVQGAVIVEKTLGF